MSKYHLPKLLEWAVEQEVMGRALELEPKSWERNRNSWGTGPGSLGVTLPGRLRGLHLSLPRKHRMQAQTSRAWN